VTADARHLSAGENAAEPMDASALRTPRPITAPRAEEHDADIPKIIGAGRSSTGRHSPFMECLLVLLQPEAVVSGSDIAPAFPGNAFRHTLEALVPIIPH
jgi:hypothetical protein